MKDIAYSFAFILAFGLLVSVLSVANDKYIEKKGGKTEYITKKLKK